MVPRLATAGTSFHGAFLYYCHDKRARTTDRVAWTQTVNMLTDCAEKAAKVMAYTANVATRLKQAAGKRRAGDKIDKPVISYSLSWHPEQKPDKEAMLEAAQTSIKKLGLEEHEAVIVAHKDEPQPHVHVIVNRVHPLTGMAANLYKSKGKLQDWAREFQEKEGTMYCPKREENHRKRQDGKPTRYVDPKIADAWKQSENWEEFREQLDTHGYALARGRKRLVVVDPYGKTHNPVRHLEGVKTKEFNERMRSLDLDALPTPEAVLDSRKAEKDRADARLRAHEEKVAEIVGKQVIRHQQERLALSDRHLEEIKRKRSNLAKHHGVRERSQEIQRLRKQLDSPGILQKMSFFLFKGERNLSDKIRTLQEQQTEAKKAINQSLEPLRRTHKEEGEQLKRRQAAESDELTQRLERWKPATKERSIPSEHRDFGKKWDHSGPSLHR